MKEKGTIKKIGILFFVIPIVIGLVIAFFRPVIRNYYFPQIGLYMTITFEGKYGYVLLSYDNFVTSISENVDYIRMRPFESAFIGLLLSPKDPKTIYYEGFEEPYIHSENFTFIRVSEDSTFFRRQKFDNAPDALWARPEYFHITVGDYMDGVCYKEAGEGNKYLLAEPLEQIR
jgi:hypothetical protein